MAHVRATARAAEREGPNRSVEATSADEHRERRDRGEALWTAAGNGATDCVRELIEENADLEYLELGWTPLIKAAVHGHVEVVRLLLEAGANKDAAGLSGDTPLILASHWGDDAIVRLLLAAGADHAAADIRGETALDKARRQGHAAVAALLESLVGAVWEQHVPS